MARGEAQRGRSSKTLDSEEPATNLRASSPTSSGLSTPRGSTPRERSSTSSIPKTLDSEALARNLRAKGVSHDIIASALHLDMDELRQMLKEDAADDQVAEGSEMVKRLMKDPEELCCPLSHQLLGDPVVAADGITYERSWVEKCFREVPGKSPMTGQEMASHVLHPNQQAKSSILSFKEETVKEILSLVQRLASREEALQLLKRGEDFVRPLLPDTAAQKKLVELLLLQLKLPGSDRSNVAKEVVSLLVEVKDAGTVRKAVLDLEESDLLALLPSLDDDIVRDLQDASLSCGAGSKGLVERDMARRLAIRMNAEHHSESLAELWQLIQAHLKDEQNAWKEAAGCLLSSHMPHLKVQLSGLSLEVLTHAGRFLDDQKAATSFARDFFKHDLGISASKEWLQRGKAPIFQELAHRLAADQTEERLKLLVKAHSIDDSHLVIRDSLCKELHRHILSNDGESDQEGLFLKVSLADSLELPKEVLPKLRLSLTQLSQAPALQLQRLAKQLEHHGRRADSERVAIFARCLQLETDRDELRHECQELRKQLETPRLEIGSSLVWDLSSYEVEDFGEEDFLEGMRFQLASSGIQAWLEIYPKDTDLQGMARVDFNLQQNAHVTWSLRCGKHERTFEHQFTNKKRWYLCDDVLPVRLLKGSLSLRLLSVQATGSEFRFEAAADTPRRERRARGS